MLTCRGVDLTSVAPAANTQIAFALQQALIKKHSDIFDPDGTVLSGSMTPEPPTTFTFGMTLKLKRPLKMTP
jgi:hypothetical protein